MTTPLISNQVPTRQTWDNAWQEEAIERPLHKHLTTALARVVSLSECRALEVGCGSAVDSAELARRGAQAFAVDYSLPALYQAQAHNIEAIHLAAGDTFCLPYVSDSFDIVFSQGMIEHFVDPVPALIEQLRVLRPGGYLCVDVPQTWSLFTPFKRRKIRRGTWFAGWETDYSLPQLERLLRDRGLEIVSSYGWLYFPAVLYGVRHFHSFGSRHHLPVWIDSQVEDKIEAVWSWLELQRWYYRWLGCIGVIARKPELQV